MKSIVIKMMSNEDKPDTNNSKGFRLVETEGEVLCTRDNDGKPIITVIKEEGPSEVYHPEGNTYILQNGKTIATFAYADYKTAHVGRATLGYQTAELGGSPHTHSAQ